MDRIELFRMWKERPFQPFRLVMSDGSAYDVVSPEWFQVGTRSSYLSVPSIEQPELVDHLVRLDNAHITHAWPLEAVREHERRDQGGTE